jgi:hypothetical protein
MKTLLTMFFGLGVLFHGLVCPAGAAPPSKPNIILFMADDFGYECVTANGGQSYQTPNLDRLAAAGLRFEHCHVQPLCTPTRVQLMTGRYNVRNYLNFGTLPRTQTTFAHLLKQAGYATGICGKWQLGREKEESGRVYRYGGGDGWIDCGAPDQSNSVTSLAVHQGQLYAGTGKYRLAGSALKESENTTLGGRVFRYDDGTCWTDCGQLPETEAVGGLVVFQGQLYASSLYRPAGFFRYEGESRWSSLPVPQGIDPTTSVLGPKRVEALTVYEGFLYASSYDGGHVYRFDGRTWTDCGRLGDSTQTYSFAQYEGHLHVGTWPSGRVYRLEEIGQWTDVGRLGEEREVMGMLVHNGRLIAGTLPLAEVHSYEGGSTWKRLTRLDHTPDVTYRRAWTMAEHDGQVFCSTLPSGKVFAFSAGQQVAWEHTLSSAWHHIAATKSADRLTLYVDGEKVAQTRAFDAASYQLGTTAPLCVGHGTNGRWNGRLSDVRLYPRTLNAAEIEALAKLPRSL